MPIIRQSARVRHEETGFEGVVVADGKLATDANAGPLAGNQDFRPIKWVLADNGELRGFEQNSLVSLD